MVHQTAAFAAIVRVVDQRDACVLQQSDGIAIKPFCVAKGAVFIGVSQSLQPADATAGMGR